MQPEAAAVADDKLARRDQMGCLWLKAEERYLKMKTGLGPQTDWELECHKQAVGRLCRLHRHISC